MILDSHSKEVRHKEGKGWLLSGSCRGMGMGAKRKVEGAKEESETANQWRMKRIRKER